MATDQTQAQQAAVDAVTPKTPTPTEKPKVAPALVKRQMKQPIEAAQSAVDTLRGQGGVITGKISDLQSSLAQKNGLIDDRLAEMNAHQPVAPKSEFTPVAPKDASLFMSMMMVCAALSGRATLNPMAAAMNNMTGIMKAQNDNNAEMLAAQRADFKRNFDAGMEKMRSFYDRYDRLLKEKNYNMAAVKEDGDLLFKEYGIDDKMKNAVEMQSKIYLDALEKTQKMNDALMENNRKLSEQAFKNLNDPEEKRKARSEKIEDQRIAEVAKVIAADAKLSGEEKTAKINALYSNKPAAKSGSQSSDPLGLGL